MTHYRYAISLCSLLLFLCCATAAEAKKKPESKKTVKKESTKAENVKPRTFAEVKENWDKYEKNLLKTAGFQGLIQYEKDVIEKMLKFIQPINQTLNKVNEKSNNATQQALALVNQQFLSLKIMENEYKRAENIRKILAKVQESGSVDLIVEIRNLPQLSTQIYNLEVELANTLRRYNFISGKIFRQSSELTKLKKKAALAAGDMEKLDELKEKYPDIYKKLNSKEK